MPYPPGHDRRGEAQNNIETRDSILAPVSTSKQHTKARFHSNQKSVLLAELKQYPDTWVLTPVNGKKQPYRRDWQNETPLSRDEIVRDIHSGKAQGVGIRSGAASSGILCIDFDGPSALPKYLQLSGGIKPPLTVGWTSGKQGRWQLAFLVPPEKWNAIATKKIATAWDDSSKAIEFLEFRWSGCQSVLPGSVHPETGSYNWLPGQSPQECEIVQTPDWVLEATAPEPKYQPSQRVISDPAGDVWDIRNFASYLDGYREGRRRGWITCKCPAHSGQSYDSLHIEESGGAFKCHAGCNPKDVYHAALELAKSRGYQVPQQRSGYQFSNLGGWLFKLKQQLAKTVERRSNWGFDRKSKVEVEPSPALAAPAIEYQAGEQLAAWSEAVRRGVKYVLVNDATGCGKSYHAGMVTPEQFEAGGIAYVSGEHRNPSTPTLQSWSVLEGRHQGLYRDEFGRLRRADKGQPYVVPPSCGRNGVVDALRHKNIPGADTSALVCQGTCRDVDLCKTGVMFGHLYNRANTLKQSRFIAYPSSLPEPSEYDYSDKVLIWDEPGQILQAHRSISVRASDLQRTIADLAVKLPEVFDALRPLLTTIHQFLSGEIKPPNKFGCKDSQIRAAIPKPEDVDIEALSAALMPNPDSLLNHTKEYGVDLADLKRSERKRFSEKDATTAARIEQELALNWLPDFLTILLGYEVGYLHINHGILTITIPERRLSEIARAAKSNIFLDATATAEDLAQVLGIAPSEILTMRQSIPDTSNLEIVQVATMGRLGVGSRRKDKDGEDTLLQKRVDALISQIQQDNPGKVGIIDFKRHTSNGDGKRHWWVDSRGVNDLEDCDALVMVGTPCRNLSDLEAEFTILYGRPPQEGTERVKYPVQVNGQPSPDLQPWFEMEVSIDLEFRAFVRRRILADIHQCIGRLRAHRRPEKQLKVCFIADYPLDVPVTLKKASHVTPEAATKIERVEMAIRDAVEQLKATKQKITQSAIATITGYSQQYISKFRVLLLLLLGLSNSKSSKNGEPPPDPGEIEFNGQIYLPLLVQESPAEILKGVITTFEAHGQAAFLSFWDAAAGAVQVKILEVLLLALNVQELRSLFAAAGVRL